MGDKMDDASITAEVKSALFSHHSTSALHTTVTTTDGVVTISGIAKNDAEKSLVTKLASDINGVVGVIEQHDHQRRWPQEAEQIFLWPPGRRLRGPQPPAKKSKEYLCYTPSR